MLDTVFLRLCFSLAVPGFYRVGVLAVGPSDDPNVEVGMVSYLDVSCRQLDGACP